MQIEYLHSLYLQSTGVTTDTRSIATGNIFFALKGEKFNANSFAVQAIEKGAAYVVVDEVHNPSWLEQYGEEIIVVENVLTTLQSLSAYHRSQFKFPVLAITGSNGKTTTKELVAAVLSTKFKTGVTKGNLNNHIGIPLTLLSINKDEAEFAVIEMGANHQGEIHSYCQYVNPDFGLITNVGLAHIEGFGGAQGVIKGKTELYRYIANGTGKVFVNADNETLLAQVRLANIDESRMITYGGQTNAFSTGNILDGNEFLSIETEGETISTNLVGAYNFENVMSAVCIGKYFGVELSSIKHAIENYVPSNNRSQQIMYGTNRVILDAYNANPSSMIEALKNFNNLIQKHQVQSATIIGEMMELGEYSAEQHLKIWDMVKAMSVTHKVFVGEGFRFLKNEPELTWFENSAILKPWFKAQVWNNCLILIKGSRKNELEKILAD